MAKPPPTQPSSNVQVPDLVKIGSMPSNTNMSIETEVLNAIVSTDRFARWQIQSKGILHSHSRITLQCKPTTANTFFPIGVGCASLISKCRLLSGTTTLSETEDFSFLHSYESLFISDENVKEREQVISAKTHSHETIYSHTLTDDTDSTSIGIGIDNGKETYGADRDQESYVWQNGQNAPSFSVLLSDMFPMLRNNQLSLFMVDSNNPITIELTFSTSEERLNLFEGATGETIEIDPRETKLICDFIYYDQKDMDAFANANKSVSFSYVDYRLNKNTITQAQARNQISNLGGANRVVNKVILMISENTQTTSLLNQYNSQSCANDGSGQRGDCELNLKYNDHYLFPINVKNNARHFHNVVQAQGRVPYLTRAEYSAEDLGLVGNKFNGYSILTYLAGQFFYHAFKLNRGERVNSRGLELTSKYLDLNVEPGRQYTQRAYLELNKVAVLKNGKFEVFFA
jgi:hypothetical protein